jgi:hypothetical protein
LRPPRPPEKRGGKHHAVVSQRRGWDAAGGNSFAEFGQHDGAGDAAVGGDRQCVAGVVVDPAEDLDVGAIGEPPVGDVARKPRQDAPERAGVKATPLRGRPEGRALITSKETCNSQHAVNTL